MVDLHNLPPGYRFKATDEELLVYYLKKKIHNEPLPSNFMNDVNIYEENPEDLSEKYPQYPRGDGWFFFTPTERKYPNGVRPKRSAVGGYWKATGKDKEIKEPKTGTAVGNKRSLVFYLGKPPKGEKTNWIMYEYKMPTLPDQPKPAPDAENKMKLDDWVLCKIYQKKNEVEEKKEALDTNVDDDDSKPVEESFSRSVGVVASNANKETMLVAEHEDGYSYSYDLNFDDAPDLESIFYSPK